MGNTTRIVISNDNVDALIEEYDGVWMPPDEISELFDGIPSKRIGVWAREGTVRRKRKQGLSRGGRYVYCVNDVIVQRSYRRRLNPFKHHRTPDGGMEGFCSKCERWLSFDCFYDRSDGKTSHGKLSVCRECYGARWSAYMRTPDAAKKRRAYRKKYRKAVREQTKKASKWKPCVYLPASSVMQIIFDRFPNKSFTEISALAGIHADSIRKFNQRSKCGSSMKISVAEDILLRLGLEHDARHVTEFAYEGQPKWFGDYLYCQKCFRSNIAHKAKGLCTSCYKNRNDPTYKPVVANRWSLRCPYCQRCGTTSKPHAARGFCKSCYVRMVNSGELKPNKTGPGTYKRKRVGLEYGDSS